MSLSQLWGFETLRKEKHGTQSNFSAPSAWASMRKIRLKALLEGSILALCLARAATLKLDQASRDIDLTYSALIINSFRAFKAKDNLLQDVSLGIEYLTSKVGERLQNDLSR